MPRRGHTDHISSHKRSAAIPPSEEPNILASLHGIQSHTVTVQARPAARWEARRPSQRDAVRVAFAIELAQGRAASSRERFF